MNKEITRAVAALFAGLGPAWAGASTLPAYETYSAAAEMSTSFFSFDSPYTHPGELTSISGATAQISGNTYTASASTTSVAITPTRASVRRPKGFSAWAPFPAGTIN